MPVLGVNASEKFGYIYSAFLDTRKQEEPVVRVLGELPNMNTTRVFCRFHLRGRIGKASKNVLFATTVERQFPVEPGDRERDGSRPFMGVLIKCPLQYLNTLPTSVSILSAPSGVASTDNEVNNLFIHGEYNPSDVKERRRVLGMCVGHMWNVYNDVVRLVEFLEMHAILGATVFQLYGHSYSKQVSNYWRCMHDLYKEHPFD
jgi:hypothetical protein